MAFGTKRRTRVHCGVLVARLDKTLYVPGVNDWPLPLRLYSWDKSAILLAETVSTSGTQNFGNQQR